MVPAKRPKSFISLAGADHLISKADDAAYVARAISSWADRYLDMAAPNLMLELFQYDQPANRREKAPRNCDVGGHRIAFKVENIEAANEVRDGETPPG